MVSAYDSASARQRCVMAHDSLLPRGGGRQGQGRAARSLLPGAPIIGPSRFNPPQDAAQTHEPTGALRELTIRYTVKTDSDGRPVPIGPPFRSSAEGAALLMPLLADEPSEVFAILCLTMRLAVIAYHEASRGALNGAYVDPREVFRAAMLANAAFVVLAHNHPSGDPTPSPEDHELTTRMADVGRLIGIEVLEHFIIGDRRYFSFRDRGLLPCLQVSAPVR